MPMIHQNLNSWSISGRSEGKSLGHQTSGKPELPPQFRSSAFESTIPIHTLTVDDSMINYVLDWMLFIQLYFYISKPCDTKIFFVNVFWNLHSNH